jgi:hypothetical protein
MLFSGNFNRPLVFLNNLIEKKTLLERLSNSETLGLLLQVVIYI